MKTDKEIRAKWKELLDRPRNNPHVIDTGAIVIEVVRWAESDEKESDWICDRCGGAATSQYCPHCKLPFPPRAKT